MSHNQIYSYIFIWGNSYIFTFISLSMYHLSSFICIYLPICHLSIIYHHHHHLSSVIYLSSSIISIMYLSSIIIIIIIIYLHHHHLSSIYYLSIIYLSIIHLLSMIYLSIIRLPIICLGEKEQSRQKRTRLSHLKVIPCPQPSL